MRWSLLRFWQESQRRLIRIYKQQRVVLTFFFFIPLRATAIILGMRMNDKQGEKNGE
jgi:hypothetical protein